MKQGIDGKWAIPAVGAIGAGQSEQAEAAFIGKLAKTFSGPAYKLAKKLEGQGASREQIWKETGDQFGTPLYRGPDDKWRQEVSDTGADIAGRELRTGEGGSFFDFVSHPEVERAYPSFNDPSSKSYERLGLSRRNEYFGGGTKAEYSEGIRHITLDKAERSFKPDQQTIEELRAIRAKPEYKAAEQRFVDELDRIDKLEDLPGADIDALEIEQDLAESTFETSPAVYEYKQIERSKIKRDRTISQDEASSVHHELQHAIQGEEGFARGGSPEQFAEDLGARKRIAEGEIKAINQKMSEVVKVKDKLRQSYTPEAKANLERMDDLYNDLMAERSKYYEDASIDLLEDPYSQYRRLTGEAEARNVQTRLPYSMSERIAKPPWSTLDVPERELINQFRSAAPLTAGGLLGLSALSPDSARASSLGTIEAAKAPWLSEAANYMEMLELPIVGRPLQGIADWARGAAYQDPDRLKRAAIGALDLI
jgi:hypothetical protein